MGRFSAFNIYCQEQLALPEIAAMERRFPYVQGKWLQLSDADREPYRLQANRRNDAMPPAKVKEESLSSGSSESSEEAEDSDEYPATRPFPSDEVLIPIFRQHIERLHPRAEVPAWVDVDRMYDDLTARYLQVARDPQYRRMRMRQAVIIFPMSLQVPVIANNHLSTIIKNNYKFLFIIDKMEFYDGNYYGNR